MIKLFDGWEIRKDDYSYALGVPTELVSKGKVQIRMVGATWHRTVGKAVREYTSMLQRQNVASRHLSLEEAARQNDRIAQDVQERVREQARNMPDLMVDGSRKADDILGMIESLPSELRAPSAGLAELSAYPMVELAEGWAITVDEHQYILGRPFLRQRRGEASLGMADASYHKTIGAAVRKFEKLKAEGIVADRKNPKKKRAAQTP